jgi:hypothetical protein
MPLRFLMAPLFFHFRDVNGLDLDTAYLQAFEAAQEMWREAIRCMEDPRAQQIDDRRSADITIPQSPAKDCTEP